jgi:hypothetical protein
MRKTTKNLKLILRRESVRDLLRREMASVKGGYTVMEEGGDSGGIGSFGGPLGSISLTAGGPGGNSTQTSKSGPSGYCGGLSE